MDRREFIRIVTSVCASHSLLATLTTRAMDETLIIEDGKVAFAAGHASVLQSAVEAETIHVSSVGTNLILDVSGAPGRYVVILYKLATQAGVERAFIHKIGRIKKSGVAGFVVKMAKSLDQDIPFMVVTSTAQDFNNGNRGTGWFEVRINSGQAEAGSVTQNHGTDPEGPHQKVVMYGINHLQKRSFAPLKRR